MGLQLDVKIEIVTFVLIIQWRQMSPATVMHRLSYGEAHGCRVLILSGRVRLSLAHRPVAHYRGVGVSLAGEGDSVSLQDGARLDGQGHCWRIWERSRESRGEGPLPAFNRFSVGFQGAGHNLDLDLAHFNNTHGAR